ncbi:hypothetical protein [Streptomyces sp. NPDC096339]|uniref:hypothetical protein n=1 Tax=Streptomyces sp. NPDC096339 TaxID=3366086 RepID=UPI003819A291
MLARPGLGAEIGADTTIDRTGVYRHPLRYVRLRRDASEYALRLVTSVIEFFGVELPQPSVNSTRPRDARLGALAVSLR